MQLLKRATDAIRMARTALEEAAPKVQGQAWHVYVNPKTGEQFRVWNATPEDMPDQMIVRGVLFDHAEPRAGIQPPEPPEFQIGDILYRYVTEQEAHGLIEQEVALRVANLRKGGIKTFNGKAIRAAVRARALRRCTLVEVQAVVPE